MTANITKPMLGFKSFRAVNNVLAGIELMDMMHKGQMIVEGCADISFANQVAALAEHRRPSEVKSANMRLDLSGKS